MLDGTKITTSFTTGSIIQMDVISMKSFLENTAITIIAQCREMSLIERLGVLESTSKLPHYDALIDEYCSGVHCAVLANMLAQYVQILYRFVEDCVLNESVKGLYLLYDKPKNGEPTWKLILLALSEYMAFVEKEYETLGRKMPYDAIKYDKYNDAFEKLMS